MKKTHTRVTARVQSEPDNLVCMARLVEEGNLETVERVFKTFGIEYEVDEIRPNTRLYSLILSQEGRYVSNDLLTEKELTEYVTPFLRKGGAIGRDEYKNLLKGKTAEIDKTLPNGKILVGYELTLKGDTSRFVFRFPSLGFGRKKKETAVSKDK